MRAHDRAHEHSGLTLRRRSGRRPRVRHLPPNHLAVDRRWQTSRFLSLRIAQAARKALGSGSADRGLASAHLYAGGALISYERASLRHALGIATKRMNRRVASQRSEGLLSTPGIIDQRARHLALQIWQRRGRPEHDNREVAALAPEQRAREHFVIGAVRIARQLLDPEGDQHAIDSAELRWRMTEAILAASAAQVPIGELTAIEAGELAQRIVAEAVRQKSARR